MAKKKATETRTKAAVGRERKLALALRALLDSLENRIVGGEAESEVTDAEQGAIALLTELGYKDLESIPKRVAALNAQLKSAVEAGDGATIAALGLELERANKGLPPKTTATVGEPAED